MRTLLLAAIAAAAFATPAAATEVILTFEGYACTNVNGGNVNQNCTASGQFIGADYGSVAQLGVSYDPIGSGGSLIFGIDDGAFTPGDNQLAYGNGGSPSTAHSIIFTPAAGYEVSFSSFRWDRLNATSSAQFHFHVRGPGGEILYDGGPGSPYTRTVNTAYFTGPVTFSFSNGGQGSLGIEEVHVDYRTVVAAVPEPGTWAMMIGGFGFAGGMLRTRRTRQMAAA